MSISRILLATLAFTALVGCGKTEPETTPAPAPAQSRSSDELFDAFAETEGAPAEGTTTEEVKEGTIPVASSAALDAPTKNGGASLMSESGRYVVQVSCIASEQVAENIAAKLKKKNFPVYLAEVDNPTPQLQGHYYRIRIGTFASIADAQAFGKNNLVPAGYDFWVDTKANDNVGIGGSTSIGQAKPIAKQDPYLYEDPKGTEDPIPAAFVAEPVATPAPAMELEVATPVAVPEPTPTPAPAPVAAEPTTPKADVEVLDASKPYTPTPSYGTKVAPAEEWGTDEW